MDFFGRQPGRLSDATGPAAADVGNPHVRPADQRDHLRGLLRAGVGQAAVGFVAQFLGPLGLILLTRIAFDRTTQRADALQADAAGLHLILQSLATGLAARRRRTDHDRIAPGFDQPGFEIRAAGRSCRAGRPGRTGLGDLCLAGQRFRGGRFGLGGFGRRRVAALEEDRQQLAIHLVAGTVGVQAQYVDLVVKRGHVLFQVEAKRALASHLDRRLGRAAARSLVGRRIEHVLRVLAAQQQVHPHVAQQLERFDAGDADPFLLLGRFAVGRFLAAGQQDRHLPPAAVAGTEMEVDRVGRHDAIFGQLDVAGGDPQVVAGAGPRGLAADRHLADQRAADQPADFGPLQIERLVELEDRALGRLQDDRRRRLIVARAVGGEEHHRARMQLDPAVGQILVVLDQAAWPDRFPESWDSSAPRTRPESRGSAHQSAAEAEAARARPARPTSRPKVRSSAPPPANRRRTRPARCRSCPPRAAAAAPARTGCRPSAAGRGRARRRAARRSARVEAAPSPLLRVFPEQLVPAALGLEDQLDRFPHGPFAAPLRAHPVGRRRSSGQPSATATPSPTARTAGRSGRSSPM